MDKTQQQRFCDLLDEFGILYETKEQKARPNFAWPDGVAIDVLEGEGYSGFVATFAFDASGQYVGNAVWE